MHTLYELSCYPGGEVNAPEQNHRNKGHAWEDSLVIPVFIFI